MKYTLLCVSLLYFNPQSFLTVISWGQKRLIYQLLRQTSMLVHSIWSRLHLSISIYSTHSSTACHLSLWRKGSYQLLHLTVTCTTVSWHPHLRCAQVDVAHITANFWAERINVSTGQADRPLALIIAAASHLKWQAPHMKIFLSIT